MEPSSQSNNIINTSDVDVSDLYKDIVSLFSKKKITTETIIGNLPSILQLIEKIGLIKKLKGNQKKQLAVDLIHRLIEEKADPNDKDKILKITDVLVPITIDAVVYAFNSTFFEELKRKFASTKIHNICRCI